MVGMLIPVVGGIGLWASGNVGIARTGRIRRNVGIVGWNVWPRSVGRFSGCGRREARDGIWVPFPDLGFFCSCRKEGNLFALQI